MKQNTIETLSLSDYQHCFKPRPHDSHKGLFGHVLIIGGAPGYLGAPLMAGMAALRVGAGLVSIATHPAHAALISSTCPEIMSHAVSKEADLLPLLEKATIAVLGPGLQTACWGKSLWTTTYEQSLPLLVDADGLNLLAEHPCKKENWILTPHPGEAARLLHCSTQDIQKNRLQAGVKLQQTFGGICVLKGAGSLILTDKEIKCCDRGNPGMSVAGMGDMLSGVIAGLYAQGATLCDAANIGVFVHALASDIAVMEGGERGLLATDILPYLRQVMNKNEQYV